MSSVADGSDSNEERLHNTWDCGRALEDKIMILVGDGCTPHATSFDVTLQSRWMHSESSVPPILASVIPHLHLIP
jgi:hypothetical protein